MKPIRRTRACIVLVTCLVTVPAVAGDYMLTISDDPRATCADRANRVRAWCEERRRVGAVCRSDEAWPIESAARVTEDVGRYFSGKSHSITILVTAFANGHVTFCGETERKAVEHALVQAATQEDVHHERELVDIMVIHASRPMLRGVQANKDRRDLASAVRKRLAHIAVALDGAIRKRR